MNKREKILKYLIPFLGGLLYGSGYPMPYSLIFFPGPISGIALLMYSFSFIHHDKNNASAPIKQDILVFLFFCLGYYSLGYYWIPQLMKVFGNIPIPFNYLVGLLFPLIIAPQYLLFLIVVRLIQKKVTWSVFSKYYAHTSMKNVVLAMLLTLFEYYTPQQFPAHIGHPFFLFVPYLGLAPIFGAPLFSFVSFWISLTLVTFIKIKKIDFWALATTVLFLLFNIFLPLDFNPTKDAKVNNIRLVQANIGNLMKVDSEHGGFRSRSTVKHRYERLSTRPTQVPLDLIVWPETALPGVLNSTLIKQRPRFVPMIIRKIIDKMQAQMFIGGYDKTGKRDLNYFETQFNTAFLFAPDQSSVYNAKLVDLYHKIKLIPFGETLPFGPFNKYLSGLISNISYFGTGKSFTLFKLRNDTYFTTAICYEILFSSFMREYLNSVTTPPHFILNLTNDSWYGDTAEPYQHLFLAKWRAIEFQIPVVRMTNTGVTSVIFPDGHESRQMEIFAEDILDIKLVTPQRLPTIFQKWGLAPLYILWVILFALIMISTVLPPFRQDKNVSEAR
ncbi:MAG: apolipoprotein N-acyltransferase [Bacteriovoracaceae bacterium]|nr:apolipoprotein N-acyltransferase [Bacteriovoracaceae bacterium]